MTSRREQVQGYADDLADTLRHILRVNELTREQAAEQAGVHANTMQRWAHGDGLEPVARFLNALEALGYRWTLRRLKSTAEGGADTLRGGSVVDKGVRLG